jgi:hypothetical protein
MNISLLSRSTITLADSVINGKMIISLMSISFILHIERLIFQWRHCPSVNRLDESLA